MTTNGAYRVVLVVVITTNKYISLIKRTKTIDNINYMLYNTAAMTILQ